MTERQAEETSNGPSGMIYEPLSDYRGLPHAFFERVTSNGSRSHIARVTDYFKKLARTRVELEV